MSAVRMSVGLKQDLPGDDAFMSRFPIHRACRDGDVGALVSMLERLSSRTPLTVEDSFCGWTPLHWAARGGQVHLRLFVRALATVASKVKDEAPSR